MWVPCSIKYKYFCLFCCHNSFWSSVLICDIKTCFFQSRKINSLFFVCFIMITRINHKATLVEDVYIRWLRRSNQRLWYQSTLKKTFTPSLKSQTWPIITFFGLKKCNLTPGWQCWTKYESPRNGSISFFRVDLVQVVVCGSIDLIMT